MAPHRVDQLTTVLAELAGARRYELTKMEIRLWTKWMESVDADAFENFLKHWTLTQRMMVTIPEASAALGLVVLPDVAFERAMAAVAEVGPYVSPNIANASVAQTIQLMGGWVKFCEDAPDSSETYKYRVFRDRFMALYAVADNQVNVEQRSPNPLIGLSARGGRPAPPAPSLPRTTVARPAA